MDRTMLKRTVTKLKMPAITGVLALSLLGAGFMVGEHRIIQTKPVSADTYNASQSQSTANASPDTNSAMVESAVNNYLNQKGIDPSTNKISQLQIYNAWARGKLVNNDSPSVFYAHNVQGTWTVVYGGQTPLDAATAQQYSFPTSWVGQTSWYN